jgi:hypothetical protein
MLGAASSLSHYSPNSCRTLRKRDTKIRPSTRPDLISERDSCPENPIIALVVEQHEGIGARSPGHAGAAF